MVEIKPMVCERCGGDIDRKTMRCQYCGTQYERKHEGTQINYVVERPGIHRLRAEVRIADEMTRRDPEMATKIATDRLRNGIADGLLDYMKISTEINPMSMCQIIRGEVRVVDPTFGNY